jgi:hypothetical protein
MDAIVFFKPFFMYYRESIAPTVAASPDEGGDTANGGTALDAMPKCLASDYCYK